MNDSFDPVFEVFNEALRLPPSARKACLDRACGPDGELRRQVEGLLESYEDAGEFLGEPVALVRGGPVPPSAAGEGPGARIGQYKLLERIGEGGCGVVFMAEQMEPVRRRVALKLIKPGMDTRSVIVRFEAERQALALMDHPGIAKVFDAGSTPSGRPYFVMELIRGVRITDYCDVNALRIQERLELFIQVCHAVRHAHQKGIIHRDIKPSNVLVTRTEEGAALPVVIDFGVAKAVTGQRLTDRTLFTTVEMLIGTPACMSPEQAALTGADVDTRTDVYSLGVLLYELLTGRTPFDTARLLEAGLDEVLRVIREEEPDRPSIRLSRMVPAELTEAARRRGAEPPCLIRAVRGDLDWIVMRAIEKDRARRYETADGLASDIRRFLACEPVSARPPGRFYKFRKTAQRNKLLFGAAGVTGLLLVVSLVLVSAALSKERQALRRAEADRIRARVEAAKSTQVTRFLEEMLRGVGPSAALGQDTAMLRGILDRTAGRLGEMTNQPAVEAELRGVIGRLYLELGKYEPARAMHLRELELRQALSGSQSEETAAALQNLGDVYFRERSLPEAEAVWLEALAIRRRLFGNEHAQVAATLNNLGAVYRRQRRLDEAESLTRQSLGIHRKLSGGKSLETADSLRNLSIILAERRRPREAEEAGRGMLAIRRELLGPEHPAVAAALMDLAWVLSYAGGNEEAEAMEAEAFLIQRRILGDEHPAVARSIYSMGGRLRDRGDLAGARGMLAAALSIQQKLLGPDHPDALATMGSLGVSFERESKWEAAEMIYRDALESWRGRAGHEDYETLKTADRLARVLIEQRKYTEAESLLGEVLSPAFCERPESADFLLHRMEIFARRKKWREAAAAAALIVRHLPEEHYRYHQLAGLLAKAGDHSAYKRLCPELLTRFAGTGDPYVAERMAADCLLLPDSGIDLKLADVLASRSVELGRKEGGFPYFQACKALSEYRLGNHAGALEWADRSVRHGERFAGAKAHAVAALALVKLGDKDAAAARLAEGNRLAPEDTGGEAKDWNDMWLAWIFARIALDEATALIQTNSAGGNVPDNR